MSHDPPPPQGGPPGQPPRAPRSRPYLPPQAVNPGEPRPRPHPAPRPAPSTAADATQFTSGFSGSLPPPPAPPRPARPPRPRVADPVTEVIPRFPEDEYDDYDEYEDDYYDDEDEVAEQPKRTAPVDGPLRKTIRGIGELLITSGLVILLFVVYAVYVTDLISAGKQDEATLALDDSWKADSGADTVEQADPQRQPKYDLVDGKAFAKMYIPAFGPDYHFSIVEGTTDKNLEVGPGHYVNTALPGNPGNFAVAGHRVGKGAPFNDLDVLGSCDAIVVETQANWVVYRVLPLPGEEAGWAQGKGATKKCEKVAPLKDPQNPGASPYSKTVGQEVVNPTQGEVISPVPHFSGALPPTAQQVSLMTLTTCHPRFSDRQRLIVHAVMTQFYPKPPGFVPDEMKEQ